jgi:hypothetical protein
MISEQRMPTAVLRRLIVSSVVSFIVQFAAMFLPAGDIRWLQGWLFLLVDPCGYAMGSTDASVLERPSHGEPITATA